MTQKTSAVRQQQHSSEGISCGYPSKHCENPRAQKRNGELHRFCEYHRVKANLHQRALGERKRQQKLVQQQQHDSDYYYRHLNDYLLQRHQGEDILELQPDYYLEKPEDKCFSEEDLQVLEALLFKEEGDNLKPFLEK